MIKSAKISGFRGLKEFDLNGLGRINLLVGKNNSGKSSILEALHIFATAGSPSVLGDVISRRGEMLSPDPTPGVQFYPEMDVAHLFYGHKLKIGSSFSISTENDTFDNVDCTVSQINTNDYKNIFPNSQIENQSTLALKFTGRRVNSENIAPLTQRGGFKPNHSQILIRQEEEDADGAINTQYVSTTSLHMVELLQAWEKIVKNRDDNKVIDVFKAIDSKIDEVVALPNVVFNHLMGRGGFLIGREGESHLVPIGSFGDGIWRLLAIATAVVRAKDGILLIDEIDAGLHHSVMANMWKIIAKAANESNIQVFATTHSQDCVRSLASICTEEAIAHNDVTIQRIEADKGRSVSYTARQIQIAAEQDIEVR
jgi:AAA15 family ATPase/GTPase